MHFRGTAIHFEMKSKAALYLLRWIRSVELRMQKMSMESRRRFPEVMGI